jgi:hypothetical protein
MRAGGGRVRFGLGWAGLGYVDKGALQRPSYWGWDGDLLRLPAQEGGEDSADWTEGVGGQISGWRDAAVLRWLAGSETLLHLDWHARKNSGTAPFACACLQTGAVVAVLRIVAF